MSIASVSSTTTAAATSSLQTVLPTGNPVQEGDDAGTRPVRHGHHGGGHMASAIAQALQSLGLAPPDGGATAAGSTSSSSTDSTDATTASGAGKVKDDLRQFMHQLFEAVKAEGSAPAGAGSGATSSSGDSQSGFAAGLSALISQVSGGTAPAALQSAFSQLASDLSPAAASASGAATDSSPATLQAFLTQLQQTLGYGQTTSGSASGSLVTTQV
jgi:hypothetical protein